MDKSAIRNFAIEARKILMKSAETEAGFYGVTKEACKRPIQKGNDFEVYETIAGTENRIYGADIKKRANLVKAVETLGFEQVIEETAYTWFNRIIAIRFMEVNDYLPTRVRVLSSETGSSTPDIVTQSLEVDLNMTPEELEKVQKAKDENRYDDAFRMLFIKQCNELNSILPGLFEKTDDYMELLLKLSYTSDGVVRMLVDSIDENNFNVETEGQVEIIGWMYQYYNTELKDDTFAKLKKNVKITKERIPAATQLFTPDWIVRYMVENSIGRMWIEHLRAINPSVDEKEKAEEYGWKYYLPEAEQEEEVQAQLVEIRKNYANLEPKDINCIDPCMGSGHILVYMFDVLMDIYRSEGFSERDAVFSILENNIRGLDIDKRAYQLSYFALMMKARGYNRTFFRGKQDEEGNRIFVEPSVYAIEESNDVNREQLKYFGAGLNQIEKNSAMNQITGLLDSFRDAKEYGSILDIEQYDWDMLKIFAEKYDVDGQITFDTLGIDITKREVNTLLYQGIIMGERYRVVITNPPYMNSSGMNSTLNKFVKENYQDSKSDISFCFMEKCKKLCSENGIYSLINIPVWMNLSSCETLRSKIINGSMLVSLINFGRGVFGSDFGSCAFVFTNNTLREYKSIIWKLFEKQGAVESIENKKLKFEKKAGYKFFSLEQFVQMPGQIISCLIDECSYEHFVNDDKIGKYATARQGMATADNNRFLRLWYEVASEKENFSINCGEELLTSDIKWVPYSKGGEYRKWYGNNYYVVNWEKDGRDIKAFKKSVVRNPSYYFKEGLTWTALTAGDFSMRYLPKGFCFDSMGPVCFAYDKRYQNYLLGLLNSCVGRLFLQVLCPNFKFDQGPLENVPIIISEKYLGEIEDMVNECIVISKRDWDERETSWDFNRHILAVNNGETKIENAYLLWKDSKDHDRKRLKLLEERLNKLFIEIYGLDSEINYFVRDDELTIFHPEKKDEIRSFISYFVGCVFGRYSLDETGIVFAGSKWKEKRYIKFKPDCDGIIPITDTDYFVDDIIKRFEEFLVILYGKESLEDNMIFISDALEGKGNSPREIIRNYFVNDFYRDHCSRYSVSGSGKRPIYWLFDSGKQNGFKCLIYMHRYNKDTLNLIRSEYLRKTEDAVENALKNAEYIIQTSASAVERAKATKERDKYVKQLNEMKIYYQALSHLALQKIEIDLDDGVKHNYQLFQGVEVIVDGGKKQKVDLLAKI